MDLGAVGRVLLLSALPISELRGGLPLALALGFSPPAAYALAVAGNLLPVPLLLLGLGRIVALLEAVPGPLGRGVGRYVRLQEGRGRTRVARWGAWALLLVVAIPLPMTGAWTGSLIAVLLGIPARRALLPIALGVLLAGVVVLLAAMGVIALL